MIDTNLIPAPDSLTHAEFRKVFGHIYENSPWVSDAVWDDAKSGQLNACDAMAEAMQRAVDAASDSQKMALLLEHPELGGNSALAGNTGEPSLKEQNRVGLTDPTSERVQQLRASNMLYRQRFSFPFIIAVTGLSIDDIQRAYDKRISNSYSDEFNESIRQVHRIAGFRLMEMSNIGDCINWKKI